MKRKEVALFTLAVALVIFSLTTFAVNIYFHYQNPVQKQITGNAGATGVVRLFVMGGLNQPIYFVPGWNFVSFYIQTGDYNITKMLMPIEGKYTYLMEWDWATQEFTLWSKGQLIKTFTHFNKNKSYFIFIDTTENINLNLSGSKFENYTITLGPDWETPDYVYEYVSPVSDNESDIVPSFYSVPFYYMMKWDTSAQEFILHSYLDLNPPFVNISGGEGFFLFTPEGGILNYVRK